MNFAIFLTSSSIHYTNPRRRKLIKKFPKNMDISSWGRWFEFLFLVLKAGLKRPKARQIYIILSLTQKSTKLTVPCSFDLMTLGRLNWSLFHIDEEFLLNIAGGIYCQSKKLSGILHKAKRTFLKICSQDIPCNIKSLVAVWGGNFVKMIFFNFYLSCHL